MEWLSEHWLLALLLALCVYFLIAMLTYLVNLVKELRAEVSPLRARIDALAMSLPPIEDDHEPSSP